MSKKVKSSDDSDAKSFEDHLKQLEQIVQQLESGQMNLSDSLKVFESGVQHLRLCQQRLRDAQERIALVVEVDSDGTARLKNFADTAKPGPDRPRATKRNSGSEGDQLF